MKTEQVEELILQALEHEMGGVKVYTQAVSCAVNEDLKEEWTKYLEETKAHVQALQTVCKAMKLDTQKPMPGREVVKHIGAALVQAMQMAAKAGNPAAAELVACECVVIAETKDHLNWELLGKCAEQLKGPGADALEAAYEEIEDQEDEHLYHTKGWCRELWIKSLGLKAVLPPPEEQKHVKTAIGAARAEAAADRAR
jgi:rubrerythrin